MFGNGSFKIASNFFEILYTVLFTVNNQIFKIVKFSIEYIKLKFLNPRLGREFFECCPSKKRDVAVTGANDRKREQGPTGPAEAPHSHCRML